MSTISNNENLAIDELLSIIRLKNIECTNRIYKEQNWYELFGASLIIENYNSKKATKGLLTTNNKDIDDIKLNDKLKWSEKFGKSKTRYKYNILGKPISEIHKILDIANIIHKLNKI